MSVLKELKSFMMRGNVIDLAVGVVIGGAFGKIVSSLVTDIIMPPIGMLLSGVDFKDLKLVLKHAAVDVSGKVLPEVSINYGLFLQTLIDFTIISVAIFFAIKAINTLKNKEDVIPEAPVAEPAPTKEEILLTEIRDLLKEKK